MPLFRVISNISAKSLGMTNGEPPGAPVISAPAEGASSGFPTSLYVGYDVVVTSFPISYTEFKIDLLDESDVVTDEGQWGGNLGGATESEYQTATINSRISSTGSTDSIAVDTRYKIYLRSVDTAGQTSLVSEPRITYTAPETPPTAAAPTLTGGNQVSYPNAPYITISIPSGTAGSFPIGTREYSVTVSTATSPGAFTAYTGPLNTPFSVYTKADGTAIRAGANVTGTSESYKVWVRYTAASPGTESDTASDTVTAALEIEPGIPASISGAALSTSSIRITRGNIPNLPTYQVKYQYAIKTTTSAGRSWIDFPTSGTSVDVTGLSPSTYYYFWARAVSIGPNGSYGLEQGPSYALTFAAAPGAVTLSFASTSVDERETAYLSWTAGTNATSYYVYKNGSFLASTTSRTYNATVSAGQTNSFYVKSVNSSGTSAASNTKTMVSGQQNVARTWYGTAAETVLIDWDYGPEVGCPLQIKMFYTFSGVPASSSSAGWKQVQTISAEFRCGYKPVSTYDRNSLCNNTLCYFYFAYGGTLNPVAIPGGTFGSSWSNRTLDLGYIGYISGTDLNASSVFCAPNDGKKVLNTCVPSDTGDYFTARNFVLTGIETTASTYS